MGKMNTDAEILFDKMKLYQAFQSDTTKAQNRKEAKKEILQLTEEYVDRLTELFAKRNRNL